MRRMVGNQTLLLSDIAGWLLKPLDSLRIRWTIWMPPKIWKRGRYKRKSVVVSRQRKQSSGKKTWVDGLLCVRAGWDTTAYKSIARKVSWHAMANERILPDGNMFLISGCVLECKRGFATMLMNTWHMQTGDLAVEISKYTSIKLLFKGYELVAFMNQKTGCSNESTVKYRHDF